MSECAEYVTKIYLHPAVNKLISKIKPVQLQQDLKQEMALSLLEQDCDRITILANEDNLLRFTLRIIWNMGTSSTSPFYKKFRQNDYQKAIEYISAQLGSPIPLTAVNIANQVLQQKKESSAVDAHEYMIFQTYKEMRNCRLVAEFYGIPQYHVSKVVNKVKFELKQKIKQCM